MAALMTMKVKPTRDPVEIPLLRLADEPKYIAAAEELAAIGRRIEQAQKRKNVAEARLRGQKSTASAADRAKALLGGGQLMSLPAEAEWIAAEEELGILNQARHAAEEKLRVVKDDIALENSKRFASVSADGYRMALEGLMLLFKGLEITRVCRGRLQGAGSPPNEWGLPNCDFQHAAAIGDPDRHGTAAWMFKEALRAKGIL